MIFDFLIIAKRKEIVKKMSDIDDFADKYWNQKETELMRMPKCSCCKNHIQDEECIELPDGRILCDECEDDLAKDLWRDYGREMFVIDTRGRIA